MPDTEDDISTRIIEKSGNILTMFQIIDEYPCNYKKKTEIVKNVLESLSSRILNQLKEDCKKELNKSAAEKTRRMASASLGQQPVRQDHINKSDTGEENLVDKLLSDQPVVETKTQSVILAQDDITKFDTFNYTLGDKLLSVQSVAETKKPPVISAQEINFGGKGHQLNDYFFFNPKTLGVLKSRNIIFNKDHLLGNALLTRIELLKYDKRYEHIIDEKVILLKDTNEIQCGSLDNIVSKKFGYNTDVKSFSKQTKIFEFLNTQYGTITNMKAKQNNVCLFSCQTVAINQIYSSLPDAVENKPPNFLLFNIVRLISDGARLVKKATVIELPDKLELVNNADTKVGYNLLSLSYHSGNATGGHYVTIVKTNDGDKFKRISDSTVVDLGKSDIVTHEHKSNWSLSVYIRDGLEYSDKVVGINNTTNFCWFNSGLQILFSIATLKTSILMSSKASIMASLQQLKKEELLDKYSVIINQHLFNIFESHTERSKYYSKFIRSDDASESIPLINEIKEIIMASKHMKIFVFLKKIFDIMTKTTEQSINTEEFNTFRFNLIKETVADTNILDGLTISKTPQGDNTEMVIKIINILYELSVIKDCIYESQYSLIPTQVDAKAVAERLGDTNAGVRDAAVKTLGELSPEVQTTHAEAVAERLGDTNAGVRRGGGEAPGGGDEH